RRQCYDQRGEHRREPQSIHRWLVASWWLGLQGSEDDVIASAGVAVIATRLVLGRLRLRQLATDDEREALQHHPRVDPESTDELQGASNARVLLRPLVDLRSVREQEGNNPEG